MKYSKIVLSSLMTISAFSAGCDKYVAVSTTQGMNASPSSSASASVQTGSSSATTVTPPSQGLGSGLGIISTPKPVSGLDEKSPEEPTPYITAAPFIIGKPGSTFNGNIRPSDEPKGSIVPAKISGKVYGYEINTKTYKILSNAKVSANGSLLNTDASGSYTGTEVIDRAIDLSASAPGYYSSTVSLVRPGENRDIHLQPLDTRPVYNPNTISFDILSLTGKEPSNISSLTAVSKDTATTTANDEVVLTEPKYPSLLSFGDKNNSRFITKVTNQEKGRIKVDINPIASQTISQGQLFIYDIERDSTGRPTNPTQMKSFIYKKDIAFRVGDQYFPGTAPAGKDETATTTDSDTVFDPIANFSNLSVKFSDSYGFNNFVCNTYAVFPAGEKVLVSRYSGASATSLSFRVPKIAGIKLSYSIEAHAGNANIGSDVVVNDLHENDSVDAYLLSPPSNLSPSHDTENAGLSPNFSWSSNQEAKGFQVDVRDTNLLNESAWEGFTSSNSIKYPSGIASLKSGSQYNYQVLAMDFNFGGLRVLSNKAEDMRLRAVSQKGSDLPFKVQLASHESKTLPKGYRVSYNTVLFRAK